jgi:hypothetical protein
MSVHEFADLAAVITIDVHEGDTLHNLTFLVWRDCGIRFASPSGRNIDIDRSGGDLDATINDLAIGVIRLILPYGQVGGRVGLQQISVHRVPAGLTTNDQILAWMRTLQGIVVDIKTPEGFGDADLILQRMRVN